MAVHEGPDVDDNFLAHVDTAFDRRRSCVRQKDDLSAAREIHQLRIHRGLMLKHVESGPGNIAGID
jgi:hypothetical protein